jgi:hypothetical protein
MGVCDGGIRLLISKVIVLNPTREKCKNHDQLRG